MSHQEVCKVIVIGMDGLDPHILEKLMDGGQLPAFSSIAEKGAYRRLTTINPAQSPVVWSTIATGSNPGYHGIFDYLTRNQQDYLPMHTTIRLNPKNVLSRRSSMFLPVRKGMPFWAFTSQQKIPTTVIRYPVTFPPEEVYGHMLSGLGVPDLKGSLGRYSFYVEGTIPNDRDRKGDIVSVSRSGDAVRTVVSGPNRLEVPVEISINSEQLSATITVNGKSFTLSPGEWSNWVQVQFSLAGLKRVSGICRFYLQAVKPELRLYLSPIQADPQKPEFLLSYPDAYTAELARHIGIYATLGIPEDYNALRDGCLDDEAFLSLCDSIMAEREKMLWHELDRFKEGLLTFVFDTTDRIQHVYWVTGDPEHPAYDRGHAGKYHNVIQEYYRRMDRILGRVLEAVDHRTVVCVVSDHGFTSFRRAVHLNSWLAQMGLMALKRPSQDEEGDPLFKNVVWEKTKAYAVGFTSIYLNLKGRERRGIVNPGADAEQLKRKIADILSALRDPKTGKAVIKRVYLRDDLYRGPYTSEGPDLIVGFAPHYRASWQTAIGGVPPRILDDNLKRWGGDHITDAESVPGIFLINRKTSIPNPSVIDIAPTILSCFQLPKPESMERSSVLD